VIPKDTPKNWNLATKKLTERSNQTDASDEPTDPDKFRSVNFSSLTSQSPFFSSYASAERLNSYRRFICTNRSPNEKRPDFLAEATWHDILQATAV